MRVSTGLGEALSKIDRRRLTSLLVEAVDSYSPSFAESRVTRVFRSALERSGVAYELQPVPNAGGDDKRANLVVQIGPEPLALLLVGHVDTIERWHEGGHQARIEGDTVRGLGTADMKGGCAALIEAVRALSETGCTLTKGLGLALVVGEEEYGDGSSALCERLRAPLTVIGEPTGLQPCTAHFGYLEGGLISSGRRAHAALPSQGANAIHALLVWMLCIIEQSQGLPFADRLAINPREIHGGGPYFVVAEHCEAMMDFHLPPELECGAIEATIREARRVVTERHPDVELTYVRHFWAPGFRHDQQDRRLAQLRQAFAGAGLSWVPAEFRSHSDAALFYSAGTLPVVCGPGDLDLAHGRDECVSLAELEQAARLYRAMIWELCGG